MTDADYRDMAREIRDLIPLLVHSQAVADLGLLADRYEKLAHYLEVAHLKLPDTPLDHRRQAGWYSPVRREVFAKLKPLVTARCPFANLPDETAGYWGSGITADQMGEMCWTKPQLVAQVRFTEWTADNRLRHAAFLGLRTDKSAKEVRKESWPAQLIVDVVARRRRHCARS